MYNTDVVFEQNGPLWGKYISIQEMEATLLVCTIEIIS